MFARARSPFLLARQFPGGSPLGRPGFSFGSWMGFERGFAPMRAVNRADRAWARPVNRTDFNIPAYVRQSPSLFVHGAEDETRANHIGKLKALVQSLSGRKSNLWS